MLIKLLVSVFIPGMFGMQCGGFRPALQATAKREVANALKYQRLSLLKSGRDYTFPTSKGDVTVSFGGHARSETLQAVWGPKIKEHVKIQAETFSERDTIGGSGTMKEFRVPEGKALHGVIIENHGMRELRIVTQASYGNVAKTHHRMPCFLDNN